MLSDLGLIDSGINGNKGKISRLTEAGSLTLGLIEERFNSDHKLYTSLAEIYGSMYAEVFDYQEQFDSVKEWLEGSNCKRVLEVGCGTGRLLKRLEEKYEAVGLDLNKEMLEIAKEKTESRLIEQDMRDIDLDEKFDALVSLGRSFSYMITDKDIKKALRSFYNVLEEGGVLILDGFDLSQMSEEYFRTWKKREFELEDKRIIRYSRSFHGSRENLVTIKWVFVIEEGEETRIVQDEATLRFFRKEKLNYLLQELGFETIENKKEGGSIITVAKKGDE